MPRVVAWETTRRCALRCVHCRGAARDTDYADELSTEEGRRLLDGIAGRCTPLLILTGGEPLLRADIFELAAHARSRNLRVVLATCGHALDAPTVKRLIAVGVQALSISLDAPDAAAHDAFRGVAGAFGSSLDGIAHCREAGLPFQINMTVTRHNVDQLASMLELAMRLGARTLDFFFLVPTGRGASLRELTLSAARHEAALHTILNLAAQAPIRVKTTCAPHMARLQAQAPRRATMSSGCMGGRGFVFVSHTGVLQPCGFLDVPCGDLRTTNFDFGRLYDESTVFRALRNPDNYAGKCGVCDVRQACGGCRARAYATTGTFLAADPACAYVPRTGRRKAQPSAE